MHFCQVFTTTSYTITIFYLPFFILCPYKMKVRKSERYYEIQINEDDDGGWLSQATSTTIRIRESATTTFCKKSKSKKLCLWDESVAFS